MPHVEANGLQLFYAEGGEGDPLLLVPGLAGDHLIWAEQREAWNEHFRVISFDNRDVGQSSYVEEAYDTGDMAADALALADALELERFHVLGLSMGGMIAQHLALRVPDRIASLTLCMTYGGGGNWARERSRLMAYDAMRRPREEEAEHALIGCFSEAMLEDPERMAYFRKLSQENPHPQPVEAYCRQLQALGAHDLRDRLHELRLPTHVIVTEHDLVVPPWKQRELADLLPEARVSVIERGSHAANMERADEFNELVLSFLLEQRERAAA